MEGTSAGPKAGQWGGIQEKGWRPLAEGMVLGRGPWVADWTCTLYSSTHDTFLGDGQRYYCCLGVVLRVQWAEMEVITLILLSV